MTRIAEIIHGWLGWCPMTQSLKAGAKEAGPAMPQENAGTAGPVIGRAVLYSRLTWIVVGLSWCIAFAALPHLPEIIPIHWNMYGEADGFSSRLVGAFGLPVIITLTAIALMVLPRFESMRERFDQARDIYSIVIFSTLTMLLALEGATLLSSAGMDLPLVMIMPMLIGFLFIVIGSLMPYAGRNTTMGFRLPWTLRDDTIWKKTQERGGRAFVVAGVIIVLGSPLAGIWAVLLMLGIIGTAVLYITVWSYRLANPRLPGQVPAQDP
jgi:uncharacterized membrane protein